MKVKDITSALEEWAPKSYQESYDNCGLLVGDFNQSVDKVLITLDVTEKVIDEAISKGDQIIIAHHPLIFKGLKKITTDHWVERCVTKAIKNDISIYAIHTNLDNVSNGVNAKIAEKLGLSKVRILAPNSGNLSKLVTFVPESSADDVLNSLYKAGAGQVGEYVNCSFQVSGTGTFTPGSNANPTVGKVGEQEFVNEKRIEVILPSHLETPMIHALKEAHPYEEVAYNMNSLSNMNQDVGSGQIGRLPSAMAFEEFVSHVKKSMNLQVVKHTHPLEKMIETVAVCGGSGSFLLNHSIQQRADAFISSDFKYHEFFEAENRINILDIGNYESEVFTKELILDYLSQKFANIAFRLSGVNTNPITFS
ncbi:MAG: Nif3-like dinuclear metal center hexameric protein [Cyclobacteriaceae bacterium]